MSTLEASQDTHTDRNTGRGTDRTEAMAELGAPEAMAVQGAPEAMAVQGAQEAMAVQGAQEAMAGGASCTPARTLLPPPKKKFHGAARGYQEPSGARQTGQDMTGQPTQG